MRMDVVILDELAYLPPSARRAEYRCFTCCARRARHEPTIVDVRRPSAVGKFC